MTRTRLHSVGVLLLFAVYSSILVATAGLNVQHSFGAGVYTDAGSIAGLRSQGGSSSAPLFVRKELTAAEQRQLKAAAASNGLYTLRLNLDSPDQYVLASVRAACLLQANREQLRVHIDQEGRVLGAQYEITPSDCASSKGQAVAERQLASEVPIKLEMPKPGPSVTVTGTEDLLGAQRGKKAAQARQAPQAQQEGQAAGEAGGKDGDGKARATPKEELTWFQRNWVYLAILFGLGLQVLKAQLEPQMQELQRQEAQRRAGAGGGPAAGAGAAGAGRGQAVRRRN